MENRQKLMVEVAKMYYYYGLSQKKIAETMKFSKAYVCQLLDAARKEGVVEIRIKDGFSGDEQNEAQLTEKYGLKEASVFKNQDYLTKEQMIDAMAHAVGELLQKVVKSKDTIAFSWGTTLYHISKRLSVETSAKDVNVVPLSGSMTSIQSNIFVSEISTKLAALFHGTPYIIPLPAIVENSEIKETMYSDSNIAALLEMVEGANVAVFTVGNPGVNNAVYKNGFITEKDVDELNKKGLAGDLCVHFLNQDGEICDIEYDERTIGATLEDIRRIPVKICIVYDSSKANVLHCILKKGYVDYLFVDAATSHLMEYL